MTQRTLVAVDVGGTKVACGIVLTGSRLTILTQKRYESRAHGSLDEILADFLAGARPDAFGIGVAGPVTGGVARVTNLPWVVDAAQLAARFGAPVTLLNDLEAHAHGLADADPTMISALQAGIEDPLGNRALIAAGTGLGEALLLRSGDSYVVSATEGGHCDFAPQDEDDAALWRFLRENYVGGHVSWERVVSGLDGFRNLYEFLTRVRGERPSEALAQAAAAPDLGPAICAAAERNDPLAIHILRWFARLYGSEAGNLALKSLSTAGLYVGGGIAPRILPWLREEDAFRRAFVNKGRFRSMLERMPVWVVTDPDVGLKGAARGAARR